MKKQIKLLALLAAGVAMGSTAEAQITYPYVVTFDSLAKSYNEVNTSNLITANNVEWFMPGVYIGAPQLTNNVVQDFLFGGNGRSARMRLTTNSSGDPSSMEMKTDLPLGADSFTFWTGMYGTEIGGKLVVSYSTNQGTSWTMVGDTINVTGTNLVGQYVGLKPNIAIPVRFKIERPNTNNIRVNVDQITVTAGAQATNIVLMSKTPTGNIHPSANTLTMQFNEDVVAGSGNVTISKVGGADQVIAANAANVNITNDVVTVTGLTLDPSSSYFVQYDSTFVEGATSSLKPQGIYNNTDWTFATTALSLQAFVENFNNCNGTELGIFTSKSVLGTAEFFCDTYNDTLNSFNPPYVSINAGSGSASFLNEDYLVTSLPVDLTEVEDISKVFLKFDEKRRFGGNEVTRGIYYSTNYAGDAATATWVAIDPDLAPITSTGTFFTRNKEITADVAALTQPFYLAFKYSSLDNPDSSKAWQWSLDNIALSYETRPNSVNNVNFEGLNLTVLGTATRNEINIRVATEKARNMNISMFDITGRQVFSTKGNFNAGTQLYTIKDANINAGMYVVRFETTEGFKVVKVMVK